MAYYTTIIYSLFVINWCDDTISPPQKEKASLYIFQDIPKIIHRMNKNIIVCYVFLCWQINVQYISPYPESFAGFSSAFKFLLNVTNDHGYVPLVVNTPRSFPRSWLITRFVTRLTRRVSLVEQELLTLQEHLSSPPVFSGVRVTRSLVLCVCFVDRCLSFCIFSFGRCAVCSSSIYGFWLPLWYLQTLLLFYLWISFITNTNYLSKNVLLNIIVQGKQSNYTEN